MAKYRKNKIDGAFTEECARIVREIKDPRVSDVMITVLSRSVRYTVEPTLFNAFRTSLCG